MTPNFKSLVREKNRESWLDELSKLYEKRFDQDYRGVGVRPFYQSKLKAKKEHVREIRRRIEEDLFTEWKNGVKSVYDVSRLLSALLESIDERRKLLDDKITAAKDNEESAGNRVRLDNQEWAHMGLLSKVIGKPDSLLDAQGEALQEQYICRTRIEALQFTKQLTEELMTELTDLKGEVDRAGSTIAAAVKKYTERIAERILRTTESAICANSLSASMTRRRCARSVGRWPRTRRSSAPRAIVCGRFWRPGLEITRLFSVQPAAWGDRLHRRVG